MKRRLATWAMSACLCVGCAKKHKSSEDGADDGASVSVIGGTATGPSTTFSQWPTLDVQALVGNAYASGQSSVTIPQGSYLIEANGSPCLHLNGFKVSLR